MMSRSLIEILKFNCQLIVFCIVMVFISFMLRQAQQHVQHEHLGPIPISLQLSRWSMMLDFSMSTINWPSWMAYLPLTR